MCLWSWVCALVLSAFVLGLVLCVSVAVRVSVGVCARCVRSGLVRVCCVVCVVGCWGVVVGCVWVVWVALCLFVVLWCVACCRSELCVCRLR